MALLSHLRVILQDLSKHGVMNPLLIFLTTTGIIKMKKKLPHAMCYRSTISVAIDMLLQSMTLERFYNLRQMLPNETLTDFNTGR